MGALHEGHLNLIHRANRENDLVVVSIYVNPTQFNNAHDLAVYPRMLDRDMELLSSMSFNIFLFAPDHNEIYPESDWFDPLDLNGLDNVLEGAFRPGHFQGVAHVVRNLFRIVEPHRAYFGRKDLQQLAVIRKVISYYSFALELIACDTYREPTGLAMSSRNMRLSDSERTEALVIFNTLEKVAVWSKSHSPKEVKAMAIDFFSKSKLRLEYLDLVDDLSFNILDESWSVNSSCCIAAYCGDVRLIDNMACK
jgi:pantoate--beta-alanine ligase